MSVESSIPRLCKSVKTFGRTPVSVPQVRGESCDIRLTWPYFIRTCHTNNCYATNQNGRVSRMSQLLPLTCGTETGVRPNVLTDLQRQGMELSTDMYKSL